MLAPLKKISLVFSGGGTGGHFFPAVAIADRIRELAGENCLVKIEFVGTTRGIEYRLRESLGYPLRLVNIRGLVRSFTLKNILVPFLMITALLKSRAILKAASPDVVVGTGGYVSWPVLRMAALMGLPTVLQEQNSFPGITTRQLATKATRLYLGFGSALSRLPSDLPALTTGNPVRLSVIGGDRTEAMTHFKLDPKQRTILVIGGSQGARSINQAVLRSLKAGSLPDGYQLLWQTGKLDYDDIRSELGDQAKRHALVPFESRMELIYAAADLAIARAGAITLAELEAVALPSLLIPFPFAAGDHQRHNAAACVARGYVESIDPDDLDQTDLLAYAVGMIDSGRVERLKQNIRQKTAGRKPAVDVIAEDILSIIRKAQETTVDR
ncbi:MAG: undecaprenyldiphospho-muramoylpentapeptide beta-N-acetylglucosaminyltransferase [candidate division Zixibacteria bacterium]|nr:undecaprenyldiphospho-muramoylpentapeptide beta-N-acetylglucosaminyltransferase [candidate division Zixibacteria bacterium]